MRQLWLEKLAEDGVIRKEAVAHIYSEVDTFMKEANEAFGHLSPEEFKKHLSTLVGGAVSAGAFFGAKTLWSKWKNRESRDMVMKSRELILGQYKDKEDREKAQARFDEIASYAPHVAMNAPLATKLVRSNLHSGISDETAQRLALVQSNYTKDLKHQGELLPKLGSVRPEVVGEMLADMMKLAGFFSGKDIGNFMKTVGIYSAVPLVSGAVAGLAASGMAKVKERELRNSLDNSFHTAVRQAPDTHKDIFKQDMSKTRQAFDALAHFAPSVALQPHAARTFMKKMLDYYEQGGMNVTDVKELTEIEKNIAGSKRPSPFARGFEGGHRFSTSGPIGKGVEMATADLMAPTPVGPYEKGVADAVERREYDRGKESVR